MIGSILEGLLLNIKVADIGMYDYYDPYGPKNTD